MTALERRNQRLQRMQWALGGRPMKKQPPHHAHRNDRHRMDIQRLRQRHQAGIPSLGLSHAEQLSPIKITLRTCRMMETAVLRRINEGSGMSCLLFDAIQAIQESSDVLNSHVRDPYNNLGKAYMNAINPGREAVLAKLFFYAFREIIEKPSASDERVRGWEDVVPFLRPHFEWPNASMAAEEELFSSDPVESITQRLEWENNRTSKLMLAEAQKKLDQKKLNSLSHQALAKTSQSWSKMLGNFCGFETDEFATRTLQEDRETEAQERARDMLRDLTPEEQELVQTALYGQGNCDDVVAQTDADTITRKNMHTLREGQWLSDEIIHFFLAMLAKRDEELCNADATQKRTHFFKSFFMTKLMNDGHQNPSIAGTYDYKNVKRWSKKVPGKDIFQLDKIVFPINVAGVHWVCAVAFMQEKRIQYYDSFGGDGWPYLESIKRYIEDEHEDKKKSPLPDSDEWKLVPCQADTPKQKNGYDCGVFTCMFADFISKDCPLVFSQDHVSQCRQRIALSILQGKAIM